MCNLVVAYTGVNIYSKDKMNLLWIEDFPLFLPKEDGSEGLLCHSECYIVNV